MYVPNYIPAPIEIPGNVSDAKWSVQLRFLRMFALIVLASIAVLLGFERLRSQFGLYASHSVPFLLNSFLASIIALSLVRTFFRNSKWEMIATLPIFLIVLDRIADVSSVLPQLGWPIIPALLGIICASLYTFLCGRDFSFIGQWALSLIASSIVIATWAVHWNWGGIAAGRVLSLNLVLLTYFCADTARLMGRRKPHDVWLAVVDLFRDELNLFGYAIRCWRHWKRHKIFVTPAWRWLGDDSGEKGVAPN